MRARKKKNTVPRLERNASYLTDRIVPEEGHPLQIEIGCGKGSFAVGMTEDENVRFYALEKVPDVMVMAVEKAAASERKNLRFLLADAQTLSEACPAACADTVFLNFSDPWPRRKDAKKRLTNRTFLRLYARILKSDGVLSIKTDNKKLFEYTLGELWGDGWTLFDLTRDLHHSDIPNTCMTEYETRFSELGQPIFHVKAKKGKEKDMKPFVLKNATVYGANFEPEKKDVLIQGETIAQVAEDLSAENVYDLEGLTILPGLIDMHIHGCAGADAGDATPEALEAMSRCLVEKGITSFCPTSMTLPYEELEKIFANIDNMKDNVTGAYIHGANMEGPYIAMSKRGAQNPAYVRNPDKEEFKKLYEGCHGAIRVVDIAPECDGAEAFVQEIQPLCPISVAHTAAGYDETVKAMEWGVRHITHLYNAQSGLAHRSPGVVGAAFDKAQEYGVRAELICDGFHIHPAALRIAFRMLGEDGSVIISDSMRAAGHHDGEYDLGGQTVYVREGKALLADGTIAASTSNVYEELKNVLSFGIPMKQAIKSATINPAKAIRVDDKTGSIEEGKNADILVVDKDMNIKLVLVKGEIKVNHLN